VDTLDLSFRKHIPLQLSADDLLLPLIHAGAWIKNIQAQSAAPAEKIQLVVRRDDFMLGKPNPWPEVFSEFRTQIQNYIGPKQAELFSGSFSTTGVLQQSAYDVALMDAYQSAFSYHNCFMCGIPSVQLLGTNSDWEEFRSRASNIVRSFEGVDEEWRGKILEAIGNIADTVSGALGAPQEFWSSMYRWKSHSGGAGIDGWVRFFSISYLTEFLLLFFFCCPDLSRFPFSSLLSCPNPLSSSPLLSLPSPHS
jgi:hypothetical protein